MTPRFSWRKWLSRCICGFFLLSLASALALRVVPPPFTPLMLIRGIQGMSEGNGFVMRKQWQPLEKISPYLVQAVIASEDQKFLSHSGFDLKAISQAYANNRKGKKQKGASTISQQTAKNVFLWPTSSYFRKAIEVYFTLVIELVWSKERIMEVYLNVAEFGPGIYGAEQAARIYFHKPASKLTKREAAILAAVLPAPRRWNAAHPTGYLLQRRQWIQQQMRNMGPISLP